MLKANLKICLDFLFAGYDFLFYHRRPFKILFTENFHMLEYISEHRNLFITGATSCGKTYMACAFGMEACKQYFNTKYIRLPDLLMDLEIARSEGNYRRVIAKYANPLVLVLDEWLLLKPTVAEQKDIFELLHWRRKLQPSSVHSMNSKNGTSSLAAMTVHWQTPS